MHRALLLPEIIATILETESSSPGFLHTCLFISKTFSLEAARILWYACGAYYPPEVYLHVTPDVKHLAQIAIQDTRRAQYYANFIHVLSFYQEDPEEHDDSEEDVYLAEARWHEELVSLQFPQLEDFTLFKESDATERNTGDLITHYAQPNIEYFKVCQGSGLSDSFFERLANSCTRLKVLELSDILTSSVSKDSLVKFLNRADALTWLLIRTGVHESWSCEVFEAIAKLPNLSHIAIPDIQDKWIDSISQMNSSIPMFPSLKELEAGISDHDLESLARFVPNLEVLNIGLQNFPPSYTILASASNFPRLTSLTVEFGSQSRISGNDLLLLVQNCPLLDSLSLGEAKNDSVYPPSPGYRPSGINIDDNIIDEIAQVLGTRIISLAIVLDRPGLLTWRSILSLARYCKNLMGLTISCNFNWQDTLSGTPEHTFPALEQLDFVFDGEIRASQLVNDSDEEMLQGYARRMFEFVPKLSVFWVEDGNDSDKDWEAAVMKIFYENWSPPEIVQD
ncbi:hypothetical protein MFRU_030g00570 [Monilinia fructicola]|uniref:F-box domain-containing protein n=1 Tax=Monilinia fructicola TaxID=38448 RepID=A0A5M9K3F1_MONFR|nr:hypothetical protein EYC84_003916 [Monilinia fructicola]KAG4027421.1 hypothetical protein MFRU_030g00570 [Monilinia fructicola]